MLKSTNVKTSNGANIVDNTRPITIFFVLFVIMFFLATAPLWWGLLPVS